MSIGRQITHFGSMFRGPPGEVTTRLQSYYRTSIRFSMAPAAVRPGGNPDQETTFERSLMKLRFTAVLFALVTLTLPLLAATETKAASSDKKAASTEKKAASTD